MSSPEQILSALLFIWAFLNGKCYSYFWKKRAKKWKKDKKTGKNKRKRRKYRIKNTFSLIIFYLLLIIWVFLGVLCALCGWIMDAVSWRLWHWLFSIDYWLFFQIFPGKRRERDDVVSTKTACSWKQKWKKLKFFLLNINKALTLKIQPTILCFFASNAHVGLIIEALLFASCGKRPK